MKDWPFETDIADELDKPTPIKYDGTECAYCGRLRVELYSDGKRICEKCDRDQATGEYTGRNNI